MAEDIVKIALAQLNPKVGALRENCDKAEDYIRRAHSENADLIVFPECYLSGYPAEDLVFKPYFLKRCEQELLRLIERVKDLDIHIMMTLPMMRDEKRYNAIAMCHKGKIVEEYYKKHRPQYGVFDEVRVFDEGFAKEPYEIKGMKIAPMICFDLWFEDVPKAYMEKGADLIIGPNASPYETMKVDKRENVVARRVQETGLPVIYLNQVGGQDDLVFDGNSFVMNPHQEIAIRMKGCQEDFIMSVWKRKASERWKCVTDSVTPHCEYLERLYTALTLGLRDYVDKNGFNGVILGLSGGIDSALSAAIAVDALGADRVKGYMMPSPYTSQTSFDDAQASAKALGIDYEIISIEPAMEAISKMLSDHLDHNNQGLAEENIQSRSRGLTLMALSNKEGPMVLATGNKSEYAVGYATLYGDMCGGFAPIKDVYKTTVFKLSEWRNENYFDDAMGPQGVCVPPNVITKAPTAELRENQKDEDSLPPYDILDGILRGLIEEEQDIEALVEKGYNQEVVYDVWKLLDRAEYKRRQSPPGVKLTSRAFGKERRYPITNGFASELIEN